VHLLLSDPQKERYPTVLQVLKQRVSRKDAEKRRRRCVNQLRLKFSESPLEARAFGNAGSSISTCESCEEEEKLKLHARYPVKERLVQPRERLAVEQFFFLPHGDKG